MGRVILAVKGLSSIARRLVVERTRRSSRVVGRPVRDLPAIRDRAALTGAADELFRVPVALGASGLAIRQVVASDVLPFRALTAA